ncbi:unnamed protein product [Microthlaspi erraticum]|uniref:Uncharacterized protein n=1 Tax=Microthlaspi erraticum TaxID=1685480 RepID=A0A6D2L7Y1_9BRAS|nr:unnamed protein product [Microthlaspi erraticum]
METPPLQSFGDEDRSSLMDRFERLSFEAHLNKALLGRSLSESGFSLMYLDDSPIRMEEETQACKGRRGLLDSCVLHLRFKRIVEVAAELSGRKRELERLCLKWNRELQRLCLR